jgi:hypothetical protein
VIGLIVAVVRMIGTSEQSPTRENLKVNDDIKEFLASQEPRIEANKGRKAAQVLSDEEILGSLTDKGWRDDTETIDTAPPADSKANKGLSDIKKSLGLE